MYYKDNKIKNLIITFLLVISIMGIYKSTIYLGDYYLKANEERIVELKRKNKSLLNTTEKNLDIFGRDKNSEENLEREDVSVENLSNNRFKIWKATLSLTKYRPILGFSSGNWHELSKNYDPTNYIVEQHYYTHNGYIELLYYNGIIAFIIMGIFIFKLMISILKQYKKNHKNSDYIFISLTFLTIMISNMFLSATLYGLNLFGVILFMVIGYYYSNIDKETNKI